MTTFVNNIGIYVDQLREALRGDAQIEDMDAFCAWVRSRATKVDVGRDPRGGKHVAWISRTSDGAEPVKLQRFTDVKGVYLDPSGFQPAPVAGETLPFFATGE